MQRRWIPSILLVAAALQSTGCQRPASKVSAKPIVAQAKPLGEADAARLVAEAIKSHNLTQLRLDCLSLTVGMDDEKVFPVDVREKHDKACGGDPSLSPRLFSFVVDRKSGAIQVEDDQGELRKL